MAVSASFFYLFIPLQYTWHTFADSLNDESIAFMLPAVVLLLATKNLFVTRIKNLSVVCLSYEVRRSLLHLIHPSVHRANWCILSRSVTEYWKIDNPETFARFSTVPCNPTYGVFINIEESRHCFWIVDDPIWSAIDRQASTEALLSPRYDIRGMSGSSNSNLLPPLRHIPNICTTTIKNG